MTEPDKRRRRMMTALALLGCAGAPARAAEYPDKPVRLIVPFAPAGLSDLVSRRVAEGLSKRLGQPFVIDNRAGANGSLGLSAAARSAADGYTLVLVSTSSLVLNPMTQPNLPFDAEKDFEPLAMIASSPLLLVINNDVPAKKLDDLIDLVKKRPGQISYASPGIGHMSHISGEMFSKRFGLSMIHVPYKGESPAITDLAAGRTHMMFGSISGTLPMLRAGKVRVLAAASDTRSSALPDVPTFAELGAKELSIVIWFGLAAPAGVSPQIARLIGSSAIEAINEADTRVWLDQTAQEPGKLQGAQFKAFIEAERARWKPFVEASGVAASR
jgi:tripartite-type tricarboxylate transporter receptor subunit TctC